MADKNLRSTENVPGKYYVDSSCIDCGLCPDAAPSVFKRYDEGGYSIVYKQPATEPEAAQAEEAREACPTESIGNDGECGEI
jgi:ferredoxin